MVDVLERIKIAQWVLERNLAWIAAAEVKVGVIVTIDIAMLGGLGAALNKANSVAANSWAFLFTIVAACVLVAGVFCAAMAMLPRVTGPDKSLLFFGKVGCSGALDYANSFKRASDTELLDDWLAQIHRNAQIACDKFYWVRKSICFSFLAVLPWFLAILALL